VVNPEPSSEVGAIVEDGDDAVVEQETGAITEVGPTE